MEKKDVTIEAIIATFSAHVGKNYPSPEAFRRNFDLLLKGKKERADEKGYALSLEKNIVFLNELVAEAERFMNALLGSAESPDGAGGDFPSALGAIEERAHEWTARRHREAFVDGTAPEFRELHAERQTGGEAYLEKLEFNYRYLMTLRIFLFEFISVLAAIRAEYAIPRAGSEAAHAIKDHLEITAHYYLGNVAVGETERGGSGAAGETGACGDGAES